MVASAISISICIFPQRSEIVRSAERSRTPDVAYATYRSMDGGSRIGVASSASTQSSRTHHYAARQEIDVANGSAKALTCARGTRRSAFLRYRVGTGLCPVASLGSGHKVGRACVCESSCTLHERSPCRHDSHLAQRARVVVLAALWFRAGSSPHVHLPRFLAAFFAFICDPSSQPRVGIPLVHLRPRRAANGNILPSFGVAPQA